MQLIKKTKKGFTLVELIVVIAIVAILAAVSVVSYIAFINKGNESADIQLVKQLNTCLQADEALNGSRSTMSEMLDVMEEHGFVVENLTKTNSGKEIVWHSKSNRFALVDDNLKLIYGENSYSSTISYDIWRFAKSYSEAANLTYYNYSVYLTKKCGDKDGTFTFYAGLDTGKNYVETLTYRGDLNDYPQDIVINTNCEVLNVVGMADNNEVKGDNVKHFGSAVTVKIISVGTQSYHEYGKILGNIFIQAGRLNIPKKAGQDASAAAVFVLVASPIINIDDDTPLVYNNNAINTPAKEAQARSNVTIKGKPLDESYTFVKKNYYAVKDYAGGLGTVDNPFLIYNSTQFSNMGGYENNFKLISDIVITSGMASTLNRGVIDGDGHKITLSETYSNSKNEVFNLGSKSTLKNLTVYLYSTSKENLVNSTSDITFENVNLGDENSRNITLERNATNQGGFMAFCTGGTVTFRNCANYYNYVSNDSTVSISPFIGGYIYNNSTDLVFENCSNYGNISAAYVGLFIANGQKTDGVDYTLSVTNFNNYGKLVGYVEEPKLIARSDYRNYNTNQEILNQVSGYSENSLILTKDSTMSLSENENGYLVIHKASNVNAYSYQISFNIYGSIYIGSENQGTLLAIVAYDFQPEFDSEDNYVTNVKKFRIVDIDTYSQEHEVGTSVEWKVSSANSVNYFTDYQNGIIVIKYPENSAGRKYVVDTFVTPCLILLNSDAAIINSPVYLG